MPRMNKDGTRDYSYDKAYLKKPEQAANNRKRKAARYAMEKAGAVKKGDGKDVAHKRSLKSGGSNARNNLTVSSKSANRSKK